MTPRTHRRWRLIAATTLSATSVACAQIAGIDQYDDKESMGGSATGGSGGQGAGTGVGGGGGQALYTRSITITPPGLVSAMTRPVYVPVVIDDAQFKAHWGPFIEVRDNDGALPIDVEMNDATSGLFLWVPVLPNDDQDIALTLRYGRSDEGSPAGVVWGDMFGVWHMKAGFQDATSQVATIANNVNSVPNGFFEEVASFENGSSLMLGDVMDIPLGVENFSVSMWVRPTPVGNNRKVAFFKGNNSNRRIAIENDDGDWFFAFRNFGPANDTMVPFANVPFDTWTHLVAVRETPSTQPMRTFSNTTKRMQQGDGLMGPLGGEATVGSPGDDSYVGEMDELRIRRYPMSEAEVVWEHHLGATQDAVTVSADL